MLGLKKYSPPFGTTQTFVKSSFVVASAVTGIVPTRERATGSWPSVSTPMMGSKPDPVPGGILVVLSMGGRDSLRPPLFLNGGKLGLFAQPIIMS
jgi:hypothetical protein